MKEKLIKTTDLSNGLKLDFYDISHKLAGDRWYVGVISQIDIPPTDPFLKDSIFNPYSVEEVKNALGETIRFQQKMERHFIDEQEKDAMLNNLMDSFIKSSSNYLSHPDFPSKYILKEFKTNLKRQTMYQDGRR